MKQGQHMSDGKATTGLLTARLPEVFLQFGFIGHGEAGAVESPDVMAAPKTSDLLLVVKAMADTIEKVLEQGQGQAAARFAIGRRRKVLAGQTGNLGASDVAMEDLYKKGIDGVDGIKKAFA